MDKTLMIANWFYENNNIVKTNSYNGNILLNKLCFYSKAMFLSLNHNIIHKDIVWQNEVILPFVYNNYNNLNCKIDLSDEELKILKIINRVYGYSKTNNISKQNIPIKITDELIIKEYKDEMLEIYECYKDEKLNEKLEIINGKYFFVEQNVQLTKNEYSELFNIKYENATYYVSRDNDGNLVVY